MTLRSGHGAGAGRPHVEVCPADELPLGVPGPSRAELPIDRERDGRFKPGNSLAGVAGRANAGATRLAKRLGLRDDLPTPTELAEYMKAARSWRRAQCSALAASVGGGYCGPGPSSIVATAALQLAWSRYFYDQAAEHVGDAGRVGGLVARASELSNAHRQNLLAAHELCAREAKARQDAKPSAHAQLAAALGGEGGAP